MNHLKIKLFQPRIPYLSKPAIKSENQNLKKIIIIYIPYTFLRKLLE